MTLSRRSMLGGIATAVPVAALTEIAASAEPTQRTTAAQALDGGEEAKVYDPVRVEWIMNIIPICSAPEAMGDKDDQVSADGNRHDVWPIVGGSFYGKGIRGKVIPGGGDFPVIRPDGMMLVDALYRLQTDDGHQIIIHNRGLGSASGKFRLLPTFNVPGRKYAWLRESVFVATLTYPVPPEIPVPPLPPETNGRLIQVFRLS